MIFKARTLLPVQLFTSLKRRFLCPEPRESSLLWIRSYFVFLAFGESRVDPDAGKTERARNEADILGGRGDRAHRGSKWQKQRALAFIGLICASQHQLPITRDFHNLLYNILEPVKEPSKVPLICHPAILPPLPYPLNHQQLLVLPGHKLHLILEKYRQEFQNGSFALQINGIQETAELRWALLCRVLIQPHAGL